MEGFRNFSNLPQAFDMMSKSMSPTFPFESIEKYNTMKEPPFPMEFPSNGNAIPTYKKEGDLPNKIPKPPTLGKRASTHFGTKMSTKEALEQAIEYEIKYGRKFDPNMDPMKLRRTISNRLSAQRSRLKEAQYIKDMEKTIRELEDAIAHLGPQVDNYKHKTKFLQLQRNRLLEQVESSNKEAHIRQVEIERKKLEIIKLKGNCVQNPNYMLQQSQNLGFDLFSQDKAPTLMFYHHVVQELPKFGSQLHVGMTQPSSESSGSVFPPTEAFSFEQLMQIPANLVDKILDTDQYMDNDGSNADIAAKSYI